ncbi:MAG: hypothetical protein JSR96_11840 [Proteobacteria bacterium]|nr:hypothetical protein [Pseudomonadota bacterium]
MGAAAITAAFAWWRDAGVDCDFVDEARSWLTPTQSAVTEAAPTPAITARAPAPPAPVQQPLGGDPQTWPHSHDQFFSWWLAEPSLDEGSVTGRVPPRGPAGAPLMVLVDHPEAEDGEHLLSGPQGKLLAAILHALGLAQDQAYIASALPRHMPMPDWAGLSAAGLGALTAHHVALARPRRLLVFGSNVSSLVGHDPAKTSGILPNFHHEGASIPVLAAPALSALAMRPRAKARLWQALLEWTGSDWIGTKQT